MTLATTQFINIIQNLGFPIAAFLLMHKFATQTLKDNTRTITDTLKENTKAITNLCISIEGLKVTHR